LLKVGSEYVWLGVTTDPENKPILALTMFEERNMFVDERFHDSLVKIHGKHCI